MVGTSSTSWCLKGVWRDAFCIFSATCWGWKCPQAFCVSLCLRILNIGFLVLIEFYVCASSTFFSIVRTRSAILVCERRLTRRLLYFRVFSNVFGLNVPASFLCLCLWILNFRFRGIIIEFMLCKFDFFFIRWLGPVHPFGVRKASDETPSVFWCFQHGRFCKCTRWFCVFASCWIFSCRFRGTNTIYYFASWTFCLAFGKVFDNCLI